MLNCSTKKLTDVPFQGGLHMTFKHRCLASTGRKKVIHLLCVCTVWWALPSQEEEPSVEQMSAFAKRLLENGRPPYADFAVWVPFGKKAYRASKYKAYLPTPTGVKIWGIARGRISADGARPGKCDRRASGAAGSMIRDSVRLPWSDCLGRRYVHTCSLLTQVWVLPCVTMPEAQRYKHWVSRHSSVDQSERTSVFATGPSNFVHFLLFRLVCGFQRQNIGPSADHFRALGMHLTDW